MIEVYLKSEVASKYDYFGSCGEVLIGNFVMAIGTY